MNRFLKILVFLISLFILFNIVFFLGRHPTALVEEFFQYIIKRAWFGVSYEPLRDFLVYGVLTVVGGFMVYVPNIILMFMLSNALYYSGLTAWTASLLHPVMKRFGLSGYSFPALLFGFGCSVNAIHSAQGIDNRKQRLITMLISPFMSCGAKFAVYVLLISAVFPVHLQGSMLFGLYGIGIIYALISSRIYRKILNIKTITDSQPPQAEPVHLPDMRAFTKKTLDDTRHFMIKAGGVIVAVGLVIWALSTYPGVSPEEYESLSAEYRQAGITPPSRVSLSLHNSYMAAIGNVVEPFFRPMGQDWRRSIAMLNSFVGNGVVISTLVTIYGIEYTPDSPQVLRQALAEDPTFTIRSALAMMLFVLLSGSCLASIAMFHHFFKSAGLTALFACYPFFTSWIISTVFYQFLGLFTGVFPWLQ
ncbi:MAG: nucleoside recognition domain-containing protein [Fibrobacterota bacterium]